MSAWRTLREEPRFARLLLGNFISGVGDWFNTVATLSLLLQYTGSGLAVGASLMIRTAPRLLLGPAAGALADRVARRNILIVTDVVSAALALLFLLARSPDAVWLIYATLLGLVVSSGFNGPARSAVVADVVRPEHLLTANALQGVASGSVMIVGAALGGVTAAAFGARVAFIVNALSFAVSAGLVVSARLSAAAPAQGSGAAGEARRPRRARSMPGWAAWREAWPVLRATPVARLVLTLAILWPVGGGVINVLVSVYAYQVFRAGAMGIGALYGAIGVGLVVGGLATGFFRRWVRWALVGGFVVEGVGHMLVSRAGGLALAAGLLALATAGAGVGNACVSFLLMRALDARFLGRYFALQDMVSSVTFSGSLLLTGALAQRFEARTLGLAAGALIAGVGLVAGVWLRRMALPVAEGEGAAA